MTETKAVSAGPAHSDVAAGFCFYDHGPLVDGELELVKPSDRFVEDLLISCTHPATRSGDPEHGSTTRHEIEKFLAANPDGHIIADPVKGNVPVYHFWLRLSPQSRPAVPMAGTVSLRVGDSSDLKIYFGQVGYNVFPPARGHHYAERACRLLFPLARHHGLRPLWITTDPDNAPSRRTCERLGGMMIEVVDVPPGHILYARGQRRKCRYRIDI
jgi:tagatose 1,6-diphosphate aldolase